MAILVNVILIAAYGIGEAKPWVNKSVPVEEVIETEEEIEETEFMDTVSQEILEQNQVSISTNAGALYQEFCVNCHGDNGMLGKFGASNLAISSLGTQAKIDVITNGKGVMAPYKDDMSKEEIESLAVFLTTLKI